ncbi:alpha/beta fold hydrolase [Roseibium litorale]|uniref:Alpha/beta hydrolase n=1 Tax=Roseibium litorale TaxID=2803841 RepID=A0ABR9CU37_9HYPH|nr:alpha/beta hydrolase [Roseibium litorale]MBD8894319.1 alpha/beta hydrolase [Roseibium litorale]
MSDQIPLNAAGSLEGRSNRFCWTGSGGLILSGRRWTPRWAGTDQAPAEWEQAGKLPLLCLPGLSRNTRDFDAIAKAMTAKGHPVIALDYRGRGFSSWTSDWHSYSIPVEAEDIAAAITHLELERFVVLGTSRGGLHAMAMAATYGPEQMAGMILNDIGPVIEFDGLKRISGSVGSKMTYESFDSLALSLKSGLEAQFPDLGGSDWLRLAQQLASPSDAGITLNYDPNLGKTLEGWDKGGAFPDLWPLFEASNRIPVLVIRGALSDILSAETAQTMSLRHPDTKLIEVEGEGHAPLLWDAITQSAILTFLKRLI